MQKFIIILPPINKIAIKLPDYEENIANFCGLF